MGALVELLTPDASVIARAFTDEQGKYQLRSVLPGKYELRASAAFLIPVVRKNFSLSAGAHAAANLTMTAVFEAGMWLPTQRRSSADPADDWKWSLRSTANRPLLRLADEATLDPTSSSTSSERSRQSVTEAQVAVMSGDGAFANGGTHQLLVLRHRSGANEFSTIRAVIGTPGNTDVGPATSVTGLFERKNFVGGGTRLLVDFAQHPELTTGSGSGLQLARFGSEERIVLGDAVMIDAGTLVTAERLLHTTMRASPYLSVQVAPTDTVNIAYRMATERGVQEGEDLDRLERVDTLSNGEGHPIRPRGFHQEIAVTRTAGADSVRLEIYRDSIATDTLRGGGRLRPDELEGLPVLADLATGTFQCAVPGLTARGVSVGWHHDLSSNVEASVTGALGTTLVRSTQGGSLADLPNQLRTVVKPRVRTALDARNDRLGANLRISYSWQAERAVTPVDEYQGSANEAYLSFRFRQKLWTGRRLHGVQAVMEATNLLAQGYQPLLGPDGQTLFLAQMPRALQGGLLFSF
jgi:hypothetical protein